MLVDGIRLVGDSDIERELTSRRSQDFPDAPANGDLFQITENSVKVPGKGPGIYYWSEAEGEWVDQSDTERDPYDMSVTIVGRPKPDAVVATLVLPRTAILLADLDKSKAFAQVPAASNAVFSINQVDESGNVVDSLGTITFPAGQRRGVVAASEVGKEMILAEGEILTIKAPLVRDATLKEISVSLAGRLAVLNT